MSLLQHYSFSRSQVWGYLSPQDQQMAMIALRIQPELPTEQITPILRGAAAAKRLVGKHPPPPTKVRLECCVEDLSLSATTFYLHGEEDVMLVGQFRLGAPFLWGTRFHVVQPVVMTFRIRMTCRFRTLPTKEDWEQQPPESFVTQKDGAFVFTFAAVWEGHRMQPGKVLQWPPDRFDIYHIEGVMDALVNSVWWEHRSTWLLPETTWHLRSPQSDIRGVNGELVGSTFEGNRWREVVSKSMVRAVLPPQVRSGSFYGCLWGLDGVSRLEELNLDCVLQKIDLTAVLRHCPQIQRLKVRYCPHVRFSANQPSRSFQVVAFSEWSLFEALTAPLHIYHGIRLLYHGVAELHGCRTPWVGFHILQSYQVDPVMEYLPTIGEQWVVLETVSTLPDYVWQWPIPQLVCSGLPKRRTKKRKFSSPWQVYVAIQRKHPFSDNEWAVIRTIPRVVLDECYQGEIPPDMYVIRNHWLTKPKSLRRQNVWIADPSVNCNILYQ